VTKNLTIKNTGKGVLTGSFASVAPAPGSPFTVTGGPIGPLLPGKTQTIAVTFAPTVKGKVTPVALAITISGPAPGTVTVMLQGTGK
jgi:hypothetical protein